MVTPKTIKIELTKSQIEDLIYSLKNRIDIVGGNIHLVNLVDYLEVHIEEMENYVPNKRPHP